MQNAQMQNQEWRREIVEQEYPKAIIEFGLGRDRQSLLSLLMGH